MTEPTPPSDPPKRPLLERAVLGVLALAVLVDVPIYLSQPLARDQGLFAWVAMVVRDGGLPVRDAWEVKGPLIYLLYAIPVGLFGPVAWGIRLFDLLFVAGGMVLLYVALRPRVAPLVAALAGVLLFMHYTSDFWSSAQADSWASVMLLGGLVLCFTDQGRRRPGVALALGALLGAMILIKPLYALFCVLPPVYVLTWERRLSRASVTFVATAALAVLGVVGLLGLFFWLRGGLGALLDVQLRYNPTVYRSVHHRSLAVSLGGLLYLLRDPSRLVLHVLALVGLMRFARTARREVLLLVTAWLAGMIALCLQDKYYPYQFFILLPVLLIGTGLGVQAALEVLRDKPRVVRALPLVGALGLLAAGCSSMATMMLWRAEDRVDFLLGRMNTVQFNSTFTLEDFYYADIASLSDYLTETTSPQDTVLVYGFDAGINFLANRHSPSRFGFQYPLVVGTPEYKARYRAEFLAALAAHPPRVILVADDLHNNLYTASAPELMRDFPELRQYIEHGYKPEARTDHYLVFRQAGGEARPPPPAGPADPARGG